jgi:WD40 repeat protein
LYDLDSQEDIFRLEGEYSFAAFALSPDGQTIASGDVNGLVQLWGVGSGKMRGKMSDHSLEIGQMAFSPDGSLLASSPWYNGQLIIWDLSSETIDIQTLGDVDQSAFTAFTFSPDSTQLAYMDTDQSYNIVLYDLEFERVVREMLAQTTVYDLLFNQDGTLLFSAHSDGTIRVWNVATGIELTRLEAHQGAVQMLDLSSDSTLLVSFGEDHIVKVWGIPTE